jgi:hypothetical protein
MRTILYKHRGILALLAFLVFVAAALGGVISIFNRDLPDPAKANREELLRWLIAKDLAKETPATQLALAKRLEEEFGSGVDWAKYQAKIDEPQRKQLFQNIPCVLRPWILEKAKAYAQLAKDRKAAFLDRLIDTLEVWRGIEKLLPQPVASAQNPAPSPKLAAMLVQEMDKVQREVPAEQQKQVGKFWADVQMHWFLRSIAPKT